MAKGPYARFGQTTAATPNATLRRHVWVAGDTLPSVTAKELGIGYDSELWRQVAEANEIDDLDAIDIGTVLKIPQPQPSST